MNDTFNIINIDELKVLCGKPIIRDGHDFDFENQNHDFKNQYHDFFFHFKSF